MRTAQKLLLITGIAAGIIALLISGLVLLVNSGLPEPEDVVFADFGRAQADALALIERAKTEASSGTEFTPLTLRGDSLPRSLHIGTHDSAFVYPDHVSLVLHSNPEFLFGARLWAPRTQPPSRDKPTKNPGVTFFFVDKNTEKSGENRL